LMRRHVDGRPLQASHGSRTESIHKFPRLARLFGYSCHKRQKSQAPTPQAPIRNRQKRKVANAKGLNLNTNLT